MTGFDTIVVVDWSARSTPSPRRPSKDAIFIAQTTAGQTEVAYHRTRAAAQAALEATFDNALTDGRRVLAGFDFPLGYPKGFAKRLTGTDDPFAVWRWLAEAIMDGADNSNNRLDVADRINAAMGGGGPFWSHPKGQTPAQVPFRKPPHDSIRFGFAERRGAETIATGASTCFQLFGTGAVASQTLLGLPRLQQLRDRYEAKLAVRPFEHRDAPIIVTEVYPSLLTPQIKRRQGPDDIIDAVQVRVLAQALAGLPTQRLDAMLGQGCATEGWILGLGHEAELIAALG